MIKLRESLALAAGSLLSGSAPEEKRESYMSVMPEFTVIAILQFDIYMLVVV